MENENIRIKEESDIGLKLCEEGKIIEGIKHLKVAANAGDTKAIVNLGNALKIIGNYEESFKWTIKGAELNDKTALHNLAIMYKLGQGTPCNVGKAVECGKKLIELGCIDEGYNAIVCAYIYARDEKQRNYSKGFEYALKGSKIVMKKNPKPKNKDKCETVIQLALCYNFGKGTKRDETKALDT